MPLSRRRLLPLPILLLFPAAFTGCKSAGIKDAYTARDSAGHLKTQVFPRDNTEIHLIVDFVAGREDAVLQVELFVPEGGNVKPDQLEVAPGKGENRIDIKVVAEEDDGELITAGPWGVGWYEADLLIDCEYQQTIAFEVKDSLDVDHC